MCEKLTRINQNENGELLFCSTDNIYYLLFNNLHLVLNVEEYNSLKTIISEVDTTYWLDEFNNTSLKRKIPLPTALENLILVFDVDEFVNLKSLFFDGKKNSLYLSSNQIDYEMILN